MVGVGAPIFLNPGVGVGLPQKLGLRIPAAKALAAIDDLIRFQRSRSQRAVKVANTSTSTLGRRSPTSSWFFCWRLWRNNK